MRKQNFIRGTILLLTVTTIVKILGLINRFVIARILTPEGFAVFTLINPTFLLLIALSQLGFPISISKIVSENRSTKRLTNKRILISASKIALINSSLLILILLLSARFLAQNLLHDVRTFYPLLALAIYIPFVAFSGIIKGYLNGLEIIDIPAYSQLIEQIIRILASIILVLLLIPYGISLAVCGAILAHTLGEIASIIYMVKKVLTKNKLIYLLQPDKQGTEPLKEILSISLPTTSSRIIGSMAHFFEPIIFASAMIQIGYQSEVITRFYGQISGYVISTLIVPSFIIIAIATILLPIASLAYAKQDFPKVAEVFYSSLLFAFIVGSLYIIIIMQYPQTTLKIFYGTAEGEPFLLMMAPFFLLYFFEQPLSQTLHAINQTKALTLSALIWNGIKLVMIYTLVRYTPLHVYGLVIAIITNILLITTCNYIIFRKTIKIKPKPTTILMLLVHVVSTYIFGLILRDILKLNFIISVSLLSLFYIFLLYLLNVGNIRTQIQQYKSSFSRQQ